MTTTFVNKNKNKNKNNNMQEEVQQGGDSNNNMQEDRLSLNIEFTDDELLYNNQINQSSPANDNSSLDSMDNMGKMRYQSERQTSIEKIVNDVLIPPLSDSSPKMNYHNTNSDGVENGNNTSGDDTLEVSDIDLSNISPLSSLQQHQTNITHPYFSTLDNNNNNNNNNNKQQQNKQQTNNNGLDNGLEKIKSPIAPINISSNINKQRIHYSNTPNILSSEYFNDSRNVPVVKDDLYFLEYRNGRNLTDTRHKYGYRINNNNSNNNNNNMINNRVNKRVHTTTSPLTPHSVHTARTTINSPHSVHSSHTPHTPHSMNHAFPRFTPYSHNQSSKESSPKEDVKVEEQQQLKKEEKKEEEIVVVEATPIIKKKCTSTFLTSGPRLNYEEEGLSSADVEAVLSQLEIRPDTLRDSSTDFRPVFSCIRPIVCHKSNTPFYAQCSTAKLGYCTWCRQLRRGNQKQGSICLNCGERLTAKYHRWYPHLVRLEPLEKTRTKSMYIKYKPVFERFGITWHNDKQFDFVIDHYMLMKIYLSTENFNIDPLHLERTYMIGVFAGREFNTGALARKLLREGTKLAMFRADFPDYYDFLRDERAAVAEQMNLRFFQGIYKCYFHAHYTNIEGWYDPSVISRESIIETFKELCNTILAHTALAHINQNNQQQQQLQLQNNMDNNNNNNRTNNGARKYTKKHNNNNNNNKQRNKNNINKQRNKNHNHHHNNHHNNNRNQQQQHQQQQNMIVQQQQQQQQVHNTMSMIPNGIPMNMNMNMNMGIPNIYNPINQINAIHNQINNNQQQQQQQQQQKKQENKNNQLLAATRSMLNEISSMPPINQLSVTNMAAITPIGKVKTFQFNNPTNSTPSTMITRSNSQTQISPAYLPPLATTPRFTVPTPRNNTVNGTAVSYILNNASPIQIQPNGSNPPSVSMLSANNLQIPNNNQNNNIKNTNITINNQSKKDEKDKKSEDKTITKSNVNNKSKTKKMNDKTNTNSNKNTNTNNTTNKSSNSLNAGAAPFLLSTSTVISPPISPRNFNRNRFVAPPPPPQSFAFPPPPLPQTTNWLPVPPVSHQLQQQQQQINTTQQHQQQYNMTHHHNHNHNRQQQQQQQQYNSNSFNTHCNNRNTNHSQSLINMNPQSINQSLINMTSQNNQNNQSQNQLMDQSLIKINPNNNLNHQNQINVALVHNRQSPLFTPTQSPQFRPFSH